jgi:hypothetical protein
MGNCLSSGPSRPSGDLSGRTNGQLDTSGNQVGVNSVGILSGITETVGADGHNHTSNSHLHNVHHVSRNPNSLPPVPDTDNNSQVRSFYLLILCFSIYF